jgi:hypothetical protein
MATLDGYLTINTSFCLPPAALLLALERIPIVARTFPPHPNPHS